MPNEPSCGMSWLVNLLHAFAAATPEQRDAWCKAMQADTDRMNAEREERARRAGPV